jgi:hypothetical protein
MHSGSFLLGSIDSRRALHPQRTILDLLRYHKYRDGLLHLVFADAIVVQTIFIEEEQVGDHGMLRNGRIVSQRCAE